MKNKIHKLLSNIAYQQSCKVDCVLRYRLAIKQMRSEKGIERVDTLIRPKYIEYVKTNKN